MVARSPISHYRWPVNEWSQRHGASRAHVCLRNPPPPPRVVKWMCASMDRQLSPTDLKTDCWCVMSYCERSLIIHKCIKDLLPVSQLGRKKDYYFVFKLISFIYLVSFCQIGRCVYISILRDCPEKCNFKCICILVMDTKTPFLNYLLLLTQG